MTRVEIAGSVGVTSHRWRPRSSPVTRSAARRGTASPPPPNEMLKANSAPPKIAGVRIRGEDDAEGCGERSGSKTARGPHPASDRARRQGTADKDDDERRGQHAVRDNQAHNATDQLPTAGTRGRPQRQTRWSPMRQELRAASSACCVAARSWARPAASTPRIAGKPRWFRWRSQSNGRARASSSRHRRRSGDTDRGLDRRGNTSSSPAGAEPHRDRVSTGSTREQQHAAPNGQASCASRSNSSPSLKEEARTAAFEQPQYRRKQ